MTSNTSQGDLLLLPNASADLRRVTLLSNPGFLHAEQLRLVLAMGHSVEQIARNLIVPTVL